MFLKRHNGCALCYAPMLACLQCSPEKTSTYGQRGAAADGWCECHILHAVLCRSAHNEHTTNFRVPLFLTQKKSFVASWWLKSRKSFLKCAFYQFTLARASRASQQTTFKYVSYSSDCVLLNVLWNIYVMEKKFLTGNAASAPRVAQSP